MAKKNFGNIADEFLTRTENPINNEPAHQNSENKTKQSAYGRPKAKDINGEEIKKLGVYITSKQFKMLNVYAVNNEIDKSEAVRHILNKFFEEKE